MFRGPIAFSVVVLFALVAPLAVLPIPSLADSAGASAADVEMLSPESGGEVIGKRPKIDCRISGESVRGVMVFLDGVDVTGAIEATDTGFDYVPVEILPPGSHSLSVTVVLDDETTVQRDFQFSSRHARDFQEAFSNNDVTLVYEGVLEKPGEQTAVPHSQLEGNLANASVLKSEKHELSVMGNIRYLDRSIPVFPPDRKGIDLINYLVTEKYTGDNAGFVAEIGDLQIQETMNTVQGLARRGARVAIGYGTFTLNSFVVNSEQVYGFRGGLGIEGTMDDHIFGVSGDLGLLDGRLRLRTIYVNGGEPGSSFGYYTAGGSREGEALGFVVSSRLLDGKLNLDGEYDISDFDGDTSDEFESEEDRAWNVRLSGMAGRFSYEALYEYTGRDYEVIGNMGLQRDRQGFTVRGGAMGRFHGINASFGRYEDNVEDDELYPRMVTYQGMVDYSFNRVPQVPMGLSYQKAIMDTSQVPESGYPIFTDMDMVSGRISYMRGAWNLGMQASYSIQNDKTENDGDSTATMITFNPTYFSELLSFAPSVSYNRSWFRPTDVSTDTWTFALDFRGGAFQRRITYELAGSFNWSKADDDSVEMNTLNTNFRVMYLLVEKLWGVLNPSVGFRGLYNRTDDKVYDQENDEFVLLGVLAASMGFSF